MWRIILSEIEYNKWMMVAALAVVIMLIVGESMTGKEGSLNFLYFLLPFVVINTMAPMRFKEKRDQRCIVLPVTAVSIGISRIMFIIIPVFFVYFTLFIFDIALSFHNSLSEGTYLLFSGIVVFIYSFFFIMYDLFYMFINKRLIAAAVLFLVLALLVNLLLFTNAISGNFIRNVIDLVDTIINSGRKGLIIFLSITIFFTVSSVFTYMRRKSFFDIT